MRGLLRVAASLAAALFAVAFLHGIRNPWSSSTTRAVTLSASDYNGERGRKGGGPSHIEFPIYHRFSSELRAKAEELGLDWAFPAAEANSFEYNGWAARRDLARHRRKLAVSDGAVSFLDTNKTYFGNAWLHYGYIEVGTPQLAHVVALDTGTDLSWLTCDCGMCAPASAPPDAIPRSEFSNFWSPEDSSTSKVVACENPFCSVDFSQCTRLGSPGTSQCSYEVNDAYANTSTSGVLFEDVLYLSLYKTFTSNITATIVLGCTQTQSGRLWQGEPIEDGLLGLGRAPFSVPSTLLRAGIIDVDSFSMCLDNSNTNADGRIAFGDTGSPNISTTPFVNGSKELETGYFVRVETIQVGIENLNVSEAFLVDTATSFTLLRTETYKAVINAYSKQVTEYSRISLHELNTLLYLELCYNTSDSNYTSPNVTLNFAGGASMPIPFPRVNYEHDYGGIIGFCLAVLDGGNGSSVLGANFMSHYNVVFNRKENTFGFEKKKNGCSFN